MGSGDVLFSLLPEPHRRIVGAGHGASFTHLIRVPGPAGVSGGISITARVGYCRDHDSIAVDVDVGRGRPAPSEMRRIYSTHLATCGAERDRAAGYSSQDIDPAPSIHVVWRTGRAAQGGSDVNGRVIQSITARGNLVPQTWECAPKQAHRARNMWSGHRRATGSGITSIAAVAG